MVKTRTAVSPCRLKEESFQDSFHRLLGRLVHTVARLDFNIGLQLRFWGLEDDTKIQALLQPRSPQLNGRLQALKRLPGMAREGVDPAGLQEMDE